MSRMLKKDDRFFRGRQNASMIYEHFGVTGTREATLEHPDLFGKVLHGDDVQRFDTRWDADLLSIHHVPPDDILGSFF